MFEQIGLIKQDTIQALLIAGYQLWTDGDDIYLVRHIDVGGVGRDEIVKLNIKEKLLKVKGGIAGAVKEIGDGVVTVNMSEARMFKCTLSKNTIITPENGEAGQTVTFIVTSLGNYTLTFQNPFISSGTRYLYLGATVAITFEYDGTYWYELADRADSKYPIRNMPFRWTFKLVSIVDYATPVVGASPFVMISVNGNVFRNVTGNPTVYEIGYGWYYVDIPATDMNADVVILKAQATNTAQTDRVIYL